MDTKRPMDTLRINYNHNNYIYPKSINKKKLRRVYYDEYINSKLPKDLIRFTKNLLKKI